MHFEKPTYLSSLETNKNKKNTSFSYSADKAKPNPQLKKINYSIQLTRTNTFSLKKKQENSTEISLRKKQSKMLITSKNSKKFKKQTKTILPWITKMTKQAEKALKFHFEIFDFLYYITPSQSENNKRLRTYFLLQNLITKRWPTWKVQVYGSFLVNLHFKHSDLDFTVLKSPNINFSTDNFTDYDEASDFEMLNCIYEFLVESKFSEEENMQLISAKVPIIKCVCVETGIHIDLSVNQQNGIKAAQIMSQLMVSYPIIRPTVMLLKYILRQRNLNEAYTGGIGSFVVFNMVYAYILFLIRIKKISFISKSNMNTDEEEDLSKLLSNSKNFSSREMRSIEDLGTFFYGLLNFYGFEFDFRNYGISNLGIGSFFRKSSSRYFYFSEKLCIINILNPTQDICRSAFNYDSIVQLFRKLVDKIFKFDKFYFGCYDDYCKFLQKQKDDLNADLDKDCLHVNNDGIGNVDGEGSVLDSFKFVKKDNNKIVENNSDCVFDFYAMRFENISYIDKLIDYDCDN